MKPGDAPEYPDPATTIPLQTQANKDVFNTALNASRVNTFTPTGSSTWNSSNVFDQAGYDAAMAEWRAANTSATAPSRVWVPGTDGGGFNELGGGWASEPTAGYWQDVPGSTSTGSLPEPNRDDFLRQQWTLNESLSPEQQQLYDANVASQLKQAGLLDALTNRVSDVTSKPPDFAGLPGLTTDLANPTFERFNQQATFDQFAQSPTFERFNQQANLTAPAVRNLDPRIEERDPYQINQKLADALYSQGSRYLDPRISRQQRDLESRLGEQGFVPGTPAYEREMRAMRETNDMAYGDLIDRAMIGGQQNGLQIFNNLLNQDIAQSQEGFNLAALDRQRGLDANTVAQQLWNNDRTALSDRNAALDRESQLARQRTLDTNAVAQQLFDNARSAMSDRNQATANEATFARQNAIFENQAAQQALERMLLEYNNPLNQLNALRSGTQVQMPETQAQYAVPGLQAPDILGQYDNQYQGQLGAYNADVSSQNSLLQMLGQLGLGAGMYLSDARLKQNLRHLGVVNGRNIYSWQWKPEFAALTAGSPTVGVIAQENMDISTLGPDGFLMVDYSRV